MAGKVSTQLVIEGKNNSKKAFDEVNGQFDSLNKQLASTGKALAAFFSVSAIAGAVRGTVELIDSYKLMEARLKLATDSQEEFNETQTELTRIAGDTGSSLESLVTLYTRISRPLKEAGRSQEDILNVTEAVATAFRVSGASAAEAENGVIQFAQALGSGALRGDEFNSVAEQAPRLMQALADGIGVPVGALKELAAQGKLTADVVTDALAGQLPTLQAELASFGDTVGAQVVQISDVLQRGFGQADTGPLIDSLKELKATLSDETVQQNLTTLAGALVKLAEAGVTAAAAIPTIGQDIGYIAARITGSIDEISRAEKEIEKLEAAANGFGILDLYMTDEQIARKLKEFQDYRAKLLQEIQGAKDEGVQIAEEGLRQVEEIQNKELDARRQWVTDTKSINDQLIKNGEAALKQRVALERKAASDLQAAKDAQLDTEKRYRDAIAQLQGGGAGEASFSSVTALKAGARRSLQDGNLDEAKRQAQQALEILLALKEAGENTYGFAGIAKELQGIEQAADSKAVENAEDRMKVIAVQTAQLKQDLEALKEVSVSPTMDQVAANEVAQQMKDFAASIAQTVTITPVTALPNTTAGTGAQGFATGGHVRGPGSGTSDSILARLSNGEYVMRAAAVQKYGLALLDRMNGLHLPGFAGGGLVEVAAAAGQQTAPHLGTLQMDFGGGMGLSVDVRADQAADLKILRHKFGGTRRHR